MPVLPMKATGADAGDDDDDSNDGDDGDDGDNSDAAGEVNNGSRFIPYPAAAPCGRGGGSGLGAAAKQIGLLELSRTRGLCKTTLWLVASRANRS